MSVAEEKARTDAATAHLWRNLYGGVRVSAAPIQPASSEVAVGAERGLTAAPYVGAVGLGAQEVVTVSADVLAAAQPAPTLPRPDQAVVA